MLYYDLMNEILTNVTSYLSHQYFFTFI